MHICGGPHAETALYGAASSDDVEMIDALIGAGADIEAPGAGLGGGTRLDDAFGQWPAARRLVERGARTGLWHAAALGLMDRVEASFAVMPPPSKDDVAESFWQACQGGSMPPPNTCLPGGEPELGGYDDRTPLDMAVRSGAGDLVEWLAAQGTKSSSDLGGTSEATGQPLTGTADAAEEGRVCAG
jgi:uncharacterized protein